MTLEEYVVDAVRRGEYKQVQVDLLNFVEKCTENQPCLIHITEEQWGNVPPVIFVILYEKGCFDTQGATLISNPLYYGLTSQGDILRQQLLKELKE